MNKSKQGKNRKNKRTVRKAVLWAALVLPFMLGACGLDGGGEAHTLEGSPILEGGERENAPGEVSGGVSPAGQSQVSGEEWYQDILRGKSAFLCPDLGNKSLTMETLSQVVTEDDSITVSVPQYTVLDLDGDGEEEAVLWIRLNGNSDYGFEVLHNRGGEAYGYTLQYRELLDLKADGTFTFSSGAADSGTGRLVFSESGYSIEKQIYSQSGFDADNTMILQYFSGGNPCTEEAFFAAMNAQEQKPDAEWQPLSADGEENRAALKEE